MQEHYKEKIPQLIYKQMDVRSLQFEDGTFDAVIDKACFDAMLCGDNTGPNSETMLNEIHRVLSPNGVYICTTYGVPDNRISYFGKKDYNWIVFTQKVPKPTISTSAVLASNTEADKDDAKNYHYIYVMRKCSPKEA